MKSNQLHIIVVGVVIAACGGAPEGNPGLDATGAADATAPADAPPSADGVTLRIRATTSEFPHADGLPGMTALSAAGGVRSLALLTGEHDPDPAILLDTGEEAILVSYDDGGDTELGVVTPETFRLGHYTLARMVQAYSQYEISATRHEGADRESGELTNLMVMSDGTRVDGELRDAGHYHSVFHYDGGEIEDTVDGVEIAPYSFTAGAYALVEDGEWAVYFPIDLLIDEPPAAGSTLAVTVNMDRAFRWVDSLALGWDLGVYDFSDAFYETVVRFGGNQFDVTLE